MTGAECGGEGGVVGRCVGTDIDGVKCGITLLTPRVDNVDDDDEEE